MKKSNWSTEWTVPIYPVTQIEIDDMYKLLDNLIKSNGGEWTGRIKKDIIQGMLNITEDWYGTMWHAIMKARKQYGIGCEKKGRAGDRYFYIKNESGGTQEVVPPELEDSASIQKIRQIKLILGGLTENKLTSKDAEDMLNVIKVII